MIHVKELLRVGFKNFKRERKKGRRGGSRKKDKVE